MRIDYEKWTAIAVVSVLMLGLLALALPLILRDICDALRWWGY